MQKFSRSKCFQMSWRNSFSTKKSWNKQTFDLTYVAHFSIGKFQSALYVYEVFLYLFGHFLFCSVSISWITCTVRATLTGVSFTKKAVVFQYKELDHS